MSSVLQPEVKRGGESGTYTYTPVREVKMHPGLVGTQNKGGQLDGHVVRQSTSGDLNGYFCEVLSPGLFELFSF